MASFGEGYTLPKKGKKSRSRHTHKTGFPELSLDNVTPPVSSSTTSSTTTTTTTTTTTPPKAKLKSTPSKAKRSTPHPPTREDSTEFEQRTNDGFSVAPTTNALEEARRQRVMAAMMDEIGDDDNDDDEERKDSTTSSDVPSNHNQFGRTSTSPATESQGQKHHDASAEKEVTYEASSIIRRTASEEFGMRFRAESAGRNGEKLFFKKTFFLTPIRNSRIFF